MILITKRLSAIAIGLGVILSIANIALSTASRGSALVAIAIFALQGFQFLVAVQAWETVTSEKIKAIFLGWLSPLISVASATITAFVVVFVLRSRGYTQPTDWMITTTIFGLAFPALLIPIVYLIGWLIQKVANKAEGKLFGDEK